MIPSRPVRRLSLKLSAASVALGCGAADPPTSTSVTETRVLFEGDRAVGREQQAQVELPSDTEAVQWSVQDLTGDDAPVAITRLVDPRGRVLLDVNTASTLVEPPVRARFRERQWAGVDLPAHDRFGVLPGTYTVTFASPDDPAAPTGGVRRLRATVRVRRAPSASRDRPLSLHVRVFLVGLAMGPTAATAPDDARMQLVWSTVQTIFRPARLDVVVEGYTDLAASDAARFAVLDSRAEFEQLLAQSPDGGDVLDVFVVRGISTRSEIAGALGLSGAIGGPAGLHGTLHSGVVVSWETSFGGGRDLLPLIVAHECAHFLGLWHTREPLPACTAEAQTGCAPWGGVDPITDTPDDDATSTANLMHWQSNGVNRSLTPGQTAVLRGHLMLRAP